jgi:hypothetical protein
LNYCIITFIGKIGITIDSVWLEPRTNSTEDVDAAERGMQFKVKSTEFVIHAELEVIIVTNIVNDNRARKN